MPTTRERVQVTVSDELAVALDALAREHPSEARSQLLTRLALRGAEAAKESVVERKLRRLLGGAAFTRVRLGIGKPPFRDDTEHYVLQPFPKADLEALADVVRKACEAVREILDAGVRPAMNRYNTRERKPGSEADNIPE